MSGARAECAVFFSHWPGRSVACAGLDPSLDKTSRGRRLAKGGGSADVVLKGSSGPASRAFARSSQRRPAATPGASSASLSRVDARVGWSTRQRSRGVERMRASRGTATFFPLAASYRFCGDRGGWQGTRGARQRPKARAGR
jgi:hypothetical protein